LQLVFNAEANSARHSANTQGLLQAIARYVFLLRRRGGESPACLGLNGSIDRPAPMLAAHWRLSHHAVQAVCSPVAMNVPDQNDHGRAARRDRRNRLIYACLNCYRRKVKVRFLPLCSPSRDPDSTLLLSAIESSRVAPAASGATL
jgi:hypothetical protein